MDRVITDIINELTQQENWMLRSILYSFADPPIKGKITKGKLKWRGIKLCVKLDGLTTHKWLEQRGTRIGPMLKFEVKFPDLKF